MSHIKFGCGIPAPFKYFICSNDGGQSRSVTVSYGGRVSFFFASDIASSTLFARTTILDFLFVGFLVFSLTPYFRPTTSYW